MESIRYVDLVIPETNWDQKKTDMHEYHIDTFVMGNDWDGKFDYLKEEGVEVVYLERTPEISTSQIKADLNKKISAYIRKWSTMKKILVTGGTGYIGSHTCIELIDAGFEVIIADNFSNSNPLVLKQIKKITGKTVKVYKCDIRDYQSLAEIFKNENIDSVIHFAGLKSVGESNEVPIKYYDNNI